MGTGNFLIFSGMHSWLSLVVLGPYHDEVKTSSWVCVASIPRQTGGFFSCTGMRRCAPLHLLLQAMPLPSSSASVGSILPTTAEHGVCCIVRMGAFLCFLFFLIARGLEVFYSWIGIHCREMGGGGLG